MGWKITDVSRHDASTVDFRGEDAARNYYASRVASPETWFAVLREDDFIHAAYVSPALDVAKAQSND